MDDPILDVDGYTGGFAGVPVLEGVTFSVRRGSVTAVVGETGSGKSLTALSVLGLAPHGFVRTAGAIRFEGEDVTRYSEADFRRIRGRRVAMMFQDSRGALNPVFTIGSQLRDVLRIDGKLSRSAADDQVEELLTRVLVPEPRRRMKQYPHQLSGGTVQRVQLALALARRPSLLILDEPTTGLDVTIQADILDLILGLVRDQGVTTLMITHDLGVVAGTCDEVVVMQDGRVRETGSCEQIMTRPADAYTQELLSASRSAGEAA